MATSTLAPSLDTAALVGTWDLDPSHSGLEWSARHAMVTTVRGRFDVFSGTIEIPEDPTKVNAEVSIDAASITSGSEDRDNHLRSPDFLNAEQHPELRFVSTGAEQVRGEEWKLRGDLTIAGVTKPVELDVEFTGIGPDPFGNTRAGATATTTINRKDWDLTWNVAIEAGGVLVSDKVKLTLDISAVKRA